MAKQLLFYEDARAAMKEGIDKLAEAVKMTLGPRGRAAVIEESFGAPQVTFDGVTVAKEIELEDKYENLGAEFIKQAADQTNDNVGDGTTTSVVLAHALINEGEKVVREKGFNVIQLAEELKAASEDVFAKLEEQREEINDNKKIQEVATLSAKDKEIGRLIAEVMGKIGGDGVVTVDDSKTTGNSYELVEGMQFDKGYLSPYMVTDQERMAAELEEPYVLVTDEKISAVSDILPLLEKVVQSGKKEVLIIAEDVEGEALATMIVNKLRGTFNVVAVKAPGFGDRRKEMLQDIAVVTGAQFVSEDIGRKLENTEIADLGHAQKVVVTKDDTTIVGGGGEESAIKERVSQIKSRIDASDSEFDKEKLQERLGKLSGGVAVIKVGAATESAQQELKQRVEDAVAATRAAMEGGIVPGGGSALFNVYRQKVADEAQEDGVKKAAATILMHALRAPVEAIAINSGEKPQKIISALLEQKEKGGNWIGFNAHTNKIGDLKEAGIVDPLNVTKTALTNALSVAANYLTIGAAITEIPSDDDDKGGAPAGGMGGGMPGMM